MGAVLCVALGIALGVGALASQSTPAVRAYSASNVAPTPNVQPRTAQATRHPVGVPAIPVTAQPSNQLGSATSEPAFTASDAAQYAQTHPLFYAQVVGPFKVLSAQFMTSQQLRDRLGGESTGLPDNALVCYIELQGTFLFGGRPGDKTLTFHTAYEVYDAADGNIVMSGGRSLP